jgi:solute carrier family 45 protein 1/2/4
MFGSEQLGTLTVIASFLLVSTHGLTAYFVKEKVLVSASTYVLILTFDRTN